MILLLRIQCISGMTMPRTEGAGKEADSCALLL